MRQRRLPWPAAQQPGDTAWPASRAPLVAAAVLVGASAGYLVWAWAAPGDPAPAQPVVVIPPISQAAPAAVPAAAPAAMPAVAPQAVLAPTAPMPAPVIPRLRDPAGDLTPDLADYVNPGERPTMAQVIERLAAHGVTGGLAAFQPPGTRPPLIGLAVPEDFVLPPGYVRHHQATDDGQRIEPVLMYSPHGPAPLDAAGRPIAVPADRLVPPELAPAGLPIRRIVVPPPAEPGPGR
jgi:hypothetical protein